MIQLYLILLLSAALGGTSKEDIVSLEKLKIVHAGETITLTCSFSSIDVAAWFKQTPGEKPVLVASAFRSVPVAFHNGFNKSGRFVALRRYQSFILSISNAKPSDSATYYCAAADFSNVGLGACTVLVLEGTLAVLQPHASDAVDTGGNATLQCSVLTDTSAEHSVYWFRQGSGESDPGIIYTHGNRSDQCEKSYETGSPTHSCVYKLPKRNLSLSDAGTYYCAVAVCGEILFGNGTKLDIVEKVVVDPTIIVLVASNIMSMVVILFLCRKLHSSHHKDAAEGHTVQVYQAEDTNALNYTSLSFTQPPSSRRSRTKNSGDHTSVAVYAKVKTHH